MNEDEQMHPMQQSIDEMRDQFERHKQRSEQQSKLTEKRVAEICLKTEMLELRENAPMLRQRIDWAEDLNAITLADSGQSYGLPKRQLQTVEEQDQLVISCGTSQCQFKHCRRRLDSQLILLHYLCDHNIEIAVANRFRKLCDGQSVVLSFYTEICHFKQNQVIGLLAYADPLLQQRQQLLSPSMPRKIYNSFLPRKHAHLESHVPVVVLICRTASTSIRRVKQTDHVFVIWLVTPHDTQLNATLRLCGRDPGVQANSIVAVRQVRHRRHTCSLMPVDASIWQLTFAEIQKISNDFRDELHLEVRLTQMSDRLGAQ